MSIHPRVATLRTILLTLFTVAGSALGQTHLECQTQYSNQKKMPGIISCPFIRLCLGKVSRTSGLQRTA